MQIAEKQTLWRGLKTTTPLPPGTFLVVETTSANETMIAVDYAGKSSGSSSVLVDWGDSLSSSFTGNINKASHTYADPGEHMIWISDDISSIGVASNSNDAYSSRQKVRELVQLGSKVTSIRNYAFNNCTNMRGVIELPNVTSIGSYAFGSTRGVTDFIFPSLTSLVQTSFYIAPSPTQIHADNVKTISPSFWDYYGWNLNDLYLRNSTCAQIKAMSGFPFKADQTAADFEVRFHGSDGIVLKDGTVVAS